MGCASPDICHTEEMKGTKNFFEHGSVVPLLLGALALMGLMTALGVVGIPGLEKPVASIALEPQSGLLARGDIFTVHIVVSSNIAVNVFGGELDFDQNVLQVQSINYNTSVADLWAEKPWYSNGDGTLNFVGGTTRKGGFVGSENLLTITFKAIGTGAGTLTLRGARILQHDGLGTDAPLSSPIDALFTVENSPANKDVLAPEAMPRSSFTVLSQKPDTDLNGDGKHTLIDTSIFMLHIGQGESRYDFNQDGHVDTKDLSIILNAS